MKKTIKKLPNKKGFKIMSPEEKIEAGRQEFLKIADKAEGEAVDEYNTFMQDLCKRKKVNADYTHWFEGKTLNTAVKFFYHGQESK